VAGILLMIPLLTADFVALSLIYFLDAGMTVGTLTVTAVGLGIGVNFGVYILARMQEEYQRGDHHDLNTAILVATGTAGKGVLFTALTVIIPVIMWYSLSDVRFWGEMGLFLSIVLLAGVMVVLPFYPAIVSIVKPKFIVGKQG